MSVIILPDRWRQQPQVPVRLHNRWLDARAKSAALARGRNLHDLVQNKVFTATGSKTHNQGVAATFNAGEYLTLFPDTSKAFDTAKIPFTALIVVDAYSASTDVGVFGTDVSTGENNAIGFGSIFTNAGTFFRHGQTRMFQFAAPAINTGVPQVWAMSSYADGSGYMFANGRLYQVVSTGFSATATNTSAFLINAYLRGTNPTVYPSGAGSFYSWMFLDGSVPPAELQELSAKPYSIWTSNRKRRYFLDRQLPGGSTAAATSTGTALAVGRKLVTSTGTAAGVAGGTAAMPLPGATLLGSSFLWTYQAVCETDVTYAGGETAIVVVFASLPPGPGNPLVAPYDGTNTYTALTPFVNQGAPGESGLQIFKADNVAAGTFHIVAKLANGADYTGAQGIGCWRYSGLAVGSILGYATNKVDAPGSVPYTVSTSTAITPATQPALLFVAMNIQNDRPVGDLYPSAGYTERGLQLLKPSNGKQIAAAADLRLLSLSSITPSMMSMAGYFGHSIAAVVIPEAGPTNTTGTGAALGTSTVVGIPVASPSALNASKPARQVVRTSQPKHAVQIDWANPLTRKLDVVFVPTLRTFNPAGATKFSYTGPPQVRVGKKGDVAHWVTNGVLSTVLIPPIIGDQPFTYLAGVTIKALNATTFAASPNDSGAVIYSQRDNDATVSPTLCISTAGFSGTNQLFFGADASGTANGANSSVPVALNVPTVLGARADPTALAGFSYGGFSIFVNGVNTTVNPTSTAGSFTRNWNVTTAGTLGKIGGHDTWPSNGTIDDADAEYTFFFRWRRALSDAEVARVSANPWQIFKAKHSWVVGAVASIQFLRPLSDIAAGGWTPSTGTDLFATLDETPANDSDYDSTATASAMTVKVGVGTSPGTLAGSHVVRYRIKGNSTIIVSLMQGSTSIASWTHSPAPSSFTTYEQALTSPQMASITNYADLRVKIEAV